MPSPRRNLECTITGLTSAKPPNVIRRLRSASLSQPDKGAVALRRAGKKGGPQAAFPFARFRSYWTTISTRRFCGSRTLSPVGTSSWLSPLPMTVIACAGTPSRTRASLTALARRSDSAML